MKIKGRLFRIDNYSYLRYLSGLLIPLVLGMYAMDPAQATTCYVGTTALLEGPAAGSESVVVAVNPQTGTWTATANDSWLHLGVGTESGTNSTNVVFSYDANTGSTRTGTLTVAGQTVTITQAGSNYTAATTSTVLVWSSDNPQGIAVDRAGNVYFVESYQNFIMKWTPTNNTVSFFSSGSGVAVDGAGNVYIADTSNNSIKKWTATNNRVVTLISSGLFQPQSVGVDGAGNVYIGETYSGSIKKWTAADSNVTTVVTGLSTPSIAVDVAGNIYISDRNEIKKWTAANNTLTTLISVSASRIAVDGAGNLYLSRTNGIQKWTAANGTLITLASETAAGVAVDYAGNIYFSAYFPDGPPCVKELPHAFVSAKVEGPSAGSDVLAPVLPTTASVLPPFAPYSDQPWLSLTGITNGVVSFSFSANSGATRTALIKLAGQDVPVTQSPRPYLLGTTQLVEGPAAGSDSVVLAMSPSAAPWTASANAPWLHLAAASQSGTASTNVVFTYDANPGATRTGTLNIGDQTLTITQAGSTYVAVTEPNQLGIWGSYGSMAVDGEGNVYMVSGSSINKWTATNSTVKTLFSFSPMRGVAVDSSGNVCSILSSYKRIAKWSSVNGYITVPVRSGLNSPTGIAMDDSNLYITDGTRDGGIKVWSMANQTLTTLPCSYPKSAAVDLAGNVYIAGTKIMKWTAANNTVADLVPSVCSFIAVDGAGNVYYASLGPGALKKWTAANNTVTTLISSVPYCSGLAVDRAGNVYIADTTSIRKLQRAFVDSSPKFEGAAGGRNVLPTVLPATASPLFAYSSVSETPWLRITDLANGIVSYEFDPNPGPVRTAIIHVFGIPISVTQAASPSLINVTMSRNGYFQFAFSNNAVAEPFIVLTTTNLSIPVTDWTVVGPASCAAPGLFKFETPVSTDDVPHFYRVRSP